MASEENDEKCGFWASFSGPKSAKSYKWVSTALVLVFLVVGGLVAWVAMKSAANKLAGGSGKYNQLSANTASYGEGSAAKTENEAGFFASEEELAGADPALKRELFGNSAGAAGQTATADAVSYPAGQAAGDEGGDYSSGSGGSVAPPLGSRLADKLLVREANLGQSGGGQASKGSALRSEEGSGNVSVRLAQAKNGAPGGGLIKGPRTSVMNALKSAFKANLYGARLSSQDAAKGWIAKAFDANPDAPYSLEYDEKVKAKLDRVNPNTIPKFLREQNVNATEAKSLGVSEVSKPEMDREGTKESLKEDKDYQNKKSSQDLAKALFTPLGPFSVSADPGDTTDPPYEEPPQGKVVPPSGKPGVKNYCDPEDEQTLQDIGLEDFIATEGFGEECGGSIESPRCCLPPGYFDGQQCPMYGPFLPDDPCGAGFDSGSVVGDFPVADTGTLWV